MMITEADLIAIQRANTAGGRDAAMAELRRRFLGLSDRNADKVLFSVLGRPAEPPPAFRQDAHRKLTKTGR